MYLNRCFQTGEQPQPGPLIGGCSYDGLINYFFYFLDVCLFNLKRNTATNIAIKMRQDIAIMLLPQINIVRQATTINILNLMKRRLIPDQEALIKYLRFRVTTITKKLHPQIQVNIHEIKWKRLHFIPTILLIRGVISEELMQKAQKLCKYASSALQYEDIANAITNLEACIKILKTGK